MSRITKWVTIRNKSDQPQMISHKLLPYGELRLNPGEETTLPTDVYIAVAMRCAWVVNVDSEPKEVIETPEAEVAEEVIETKKTRKHKEKSDDED